MGPGIAISSNGTRKFEALGIDHRFIDSFPLRPHRLEGRYVAITVVDDAGMVQLQQGVTRYVPWTRRAIIP